MVVCVGARRAHQSLCQSLCPARLGALRHARRLALRAHTTVAQQEGLMQMANYKKQQGEQWAEHRRRRDEEERRQRVTVITDFDAGDPEATLHAMADEILKYRRAVRLLAKAIGWADAGAP